VPRPLENVLAEMIPALAPRFSPALPCVCGGEPIFLGNTPEMDPDYLDGSFWRCQSCTCLIWIGPELVGPDGREGQARIGGTKGGKTTIEESDIARKK
jgi:hypothetical protein